MSTYVTKNYWVLDKNNNVILGNNDDTGIPATEINECLAYAKETDDVELLDYVPYTPFFLLDDKNNVVLEDDHTGIILNYGESLSNHDYTPFAVYSDTDNSLIFYYDIQPSVGDTYNKRVVTEIYTGWDTDVYDYWEDAPWYSRIPSLKSVSFDRTFANNVYPKSIAFWFVNFTDDIDLNLDNLDTKYTENMHGLFDSSSKLTNIDLSSFDTSCVTDMGYMFAGSPDLKTINVSSFDTSNVTDMEDMFYACESVEILDLRNFDTTNVISYKYFATECHNLQEILISSTFDLFVKSTTALVDQQYWHNSSLDNLNDYLIGVSGDLDCLIGQEETKIPFAVYSETDNSLIFYNDYLSDVGTTYNNKTVTSVYTGFDTEIYSSSSSVPWYSEREVFTSVVFDKSFANVKPIATACWFSYFKNCTGIDLTYLDTSEVTTMHDMFYYCSSLTSLDVSNFNTTNVTSMEFMFSYCDSLISLDVSNFNTTKVTTMYSMFAYCDSLTSLNVSNFDTTNVTTMYGMFHFCSSLTSLDVSNFNTTNVTSMWFMFAYCNSLTSLDVSNFDTAKVTTMYDMFYNCSSLTSLDVSNFNTTNVTGMYEMFSYCSSLTTIYSNDNNFVTTAVTSGNAMFTNCSKLVGGNGTTYNSSNVTYTMAHVDVDGNPGYFTGKTAFTVYSTDDNSLTFYSDLHIPETGGVYKNKTVSNVYTGFTTTEYTEANLPAWHEVCELVKSVLFDESFADVQPLYTAYWFYEMINCTSVDTKNLDTSLVTDMHDMFSGLESLEKLNVNDLDVRNVTSMYGIFYNCFKLTTIDISNWQTDSLTDVHGMFDRCSSVVTLDVSNINTSKVTDMERMFYYCYALQTIYSDDDVFVTTDVTTSSSMFTNDTNLVGGNGTKFDSSHNDASYAHVDTTSNPGYFTAK